MAFKGSPSDDQHRSTTEAAADARIETDRAGAPSTFRGRIDALVRDVYGFQDRLVASFAPYGVAATYYAFAFVFVYFGLQKLIPGNVAPVTGSIALFVGAFGIPVAIAGPFIGLYEVTLGTLFLTRRLRSAFFLFFGHQLVALLPLVVIPYHSFQPPWIVLGGLALPWSLDWFAAFILKNLVFVGAFMLLASRELGDRPSNAATASEAPDGTTVDAGNDRSNERTTT